MFRTMLKSKIHRATVTHADLMDAADLLEGEQVTIVDIDIGNRLVVFVDADNRQIDLGDDPARVPDDAGGLLSPRAVR